MAKRAHSEVQQILDGLDAENKQVLVILINLQGKRTRRGITRQADSG